MQKTIFKNGLRVITVPMKGTKTVTVLVGVGAGSRYETKKINGISHFLEHMLFKGTKKRPNSQAISEELDAVGGEFNAATGAEQTYFYAKVGSRYQNLALDVISDIILNSILKEEEINREKGVIIEEGNMIKDTPMQYVGELFEKLLYGKETVGWNILGEKETILKMERKDFLSYINDYYVAQNIVVCVAGNINHKNTLNEVKKYFTNIKEKKPKKRKKIKDFQTKPESLVQFKKTDQAHFCLGVRAYNIFHPDKYALSLLSVILGGNMSSRLFVKVREKEGLAYYIRTNVETYTDTGYLVTQSGVDNQKIEKAIKIILNEYKDIREKGVNEKELKRAKEYIKGKMLLELELSDEMAAFFANQEILTNKILTVEEKFAKIDKVTVKDIQRVAKDIFVPQKLNLALIGPFKKNLCHQLLKQL
ncbi:MAG: pitrilysin family protein [Minisyncoccales bacterium]